jgi:Tfp pilus assembly protein PilP
MKQKHQVMVLAVLVVVAVLIWTLEWRQKTPSMQTAAFIEDYKVLAVENPQIRWPELERAQKTEYKSNGRDPFSTKAPPTPEEIRDENKNAGSTPPPPPPPPPKPTTASLPANLKYFGYGTIPNGTPRRAFITDGDDVYIVSEGDTLLGRYRIVKVGNTNLEFQEISSGLPGTTPLDEQAAPPSA